MPLILGTNSIKDTGYNVANSLRFDDGSSDRLNRTLGTPTNNYKWTYSFWLKRGILGSEDAITGAISDSQNKSIILFRTDDQLEIMDLQSDSYVMQKKTNRKFRDVSAWYHIVISSDATLSSPETKIYVNGVEETSFATTNEYSQNQANLWNSAIANHIGASDSSSRFWDGYLAEFVFIDGQVLDPTSFGEFDEDSPTIWKPKDVSALTFGNNGFYLDFENASSLGADVSGNSNNFTVNNLTSIDQSTDTCTNNFITMNPLDSYYSASTFSEGNLKIVSSSGNYSPDMGTIGLSAGKWFWEVKIDTTSTEDMVGITGNQRLSSGNSTSHLGGMLYDFAYNSYGRFYNNNGYVSYDATFGSGDIIGVALDLDSATNTIQFYKNGSAQGSKNITHVSSTENGFYHVSAGDFTSGASMTFSSNFGSPPYAISSGNADGNGYGNFEYSVPSGYYSINTKNLAEFG